MCYSFFVTAAPEEPGFLKEANTTVTRLALDKFLKNTYILVVSKKAHSTRPPRTVGSVNALEFVSVCSCYSQILRQCISREEAWMNHLDQSVLPLHTIFSVYSKENLRRKR